MARSPIAGFGSRSAFRNPGILSPPRSTVRMVTGRPPSFSSTLR